MTMTGSGAVGRPRLPIQKAYLQTALQLLVDGSKILRCRRIVNDTSSENDITAFLSRDMKDVQRLSKSDILTWDVRVGLPATEENLPTTYELDFKFRWRTFDMDKYIAAEAKKLRGAPPYGASAYVQSGVMRFTECIYSRAHDYGIMVGYLTTPPIDKAVSRVREVMGKPKKRIALTAPFRPDISLCTHPYTHHSSHTQKGEGTQITLVHVFLDLS